MDVRAYYAKRLTELEGRCGRKKSELQRIVLYRILSFCAVLSFIWPVFLEGSPWIWPLVAMGAIALAVLVKMHVRLRSELRVLESMLEIVNGEMKSMDGRHSHWHSGDEFKDVDSHFSHDLDLFGEGSLFQYLNRAGLAMGRTKLGTWMKNPLLDTTAIHRRQIAVEELSNLPEWRQQLQALGMGLPPQSLDIGDILAWCNRPFEDGVANWTKWLNWFWPLVFIGTIAAYNLSYIGDSLLLLIVLIPLIFASLRLKKTSAHFRQLEKVYKSFRSASIVFEHLEDQRFESELNVALKKRASGASQAFKSLATTMELFDSRFNYIIGLLGNSIMHWDLMCVRRLGEWHAEHARSVEGWLDVLAEIEALSSLAAMRFNHRSHTIFPTFSTGDLHAVGIAHPLIFSKSRVANDFDLGSTQFAIITGANMAGKSTFLRTVGVSLVLAGMGGTVVASEFRFKPRRLYSSMRTEDSLYSNESYFFNELKRLHTLVNLLADGKEYFVILDEILKGTNSKDKAEGSFKFMEKLTSLPCTGIIATHDLSLCELQKDYPDEVVNLFFDVEIKNDDLHFDYKLRPGVCENMNATFLMKKMGITG